MPRLTRPELATRAGLAGLLAVLSLLPFAACKSDLADKMGAGRSAREASAKSALAELIDVRAKTIADRYESRELLDGKGHPLARWRRASVQDHLNERARALASSNERSALARSFNVVTQFLDEQADYWADTKGKLNAYMAFLKGYIENAKDPRAPFVQNARFDRSFVHADHLFRLQHLPEEKRLTSYYRFWKFAFDFPPRRREPFIYYVNRLCSEKLRDYCQPLMWEHRPYALKKPYIEQLLANLTAFVADYPDSPFQPVIRQIRMLYEEELRHVPLFEEYPVLAEARTNKDAVGGNELIYGPRGVAFNQELMLELPGDRVTLGGAEREELRRAFSEKLDKMIKAEAEVVPDPSIERVVVRIDRNTPLAEVKPLFEALLDHQLIVLGLISRRRADGSNRKVGTYLAAYNTPPPLDEEEEQRKAPEVREKEAKERLEHDPRRRVPTEIAGMTCRALGRTREFETRTKQATTYVAYGPETISFGPISAPESYVEATAEAAAPTKTVPTAAALTEPAQLDEWTDAPGDAIVLAFHKNLSWQQVITFLQWAHIRCKDETCKEPEERTHQITIALCE